MNFDTVLYETSARVATLTLNRPDRLNAIDERMSRELRQAADKQAGDKQTGPPAFSFI